MTTTTQHERAFRFRQRNRGQTNNILLGPASLLPFKREWRALANALPNGAVLVIDLSRERSQTAMQSVAAQFRVAGHLVKRITPNDPCCESDLEKRCEPAASLPV